MSRIACNIVFIVIIHYSIRYFLTNLAVFYHNRSGYIISVPIAVLCPEDNCIRCVCISNPFGVDSRIIVKFMSEHKLCTCRITASFPGST